MINKLQIEGVVCGGYGIDDAVRINKYESGKTKVEFSIENEDACYKSIFACVIWSNGPISPAFVAGSHIMISGKLGHKSWIDQNTGKKQYRMVVNPRNIKILSKDGQPPNRSEGVTPLPAGLDHDIPGLPSLSQDATPDINENGIPF